MSIYQQRASSSIFLLGVIFHRAKSFNSLYSDKYRQSKFDIAEANSLKAVYSPNLIIFNVDYGQSGE